MVDSQVQVRIIDLAWEWAKATMPPARGPRMQETRIEARAKGFDQAYRAILKTVESGGLSTSQPR